MERSDSHTGFDRQRGGHRSLLKWGEERGTADYAVKCNHAAAKLCYQCSDTTHNLYHAFSDEKLLQLLFMACNFYQTGFVCTLGYVDLHLFPGGRGCGLANDISSCSLVR